MTREGWEFDEVPHHMGGVRRRYGFPNGYGASVVRFYLPSFTRMGVCEYGSYTDNENEWEVGVMVRDENGGYSLTYDTPIADDVIGHVQDGAELDALLERIAGLPPGSHPSAPHSGRTPTTVETLSPKDGD